MTGTYRFAKNIDGVGSYASISILAAAAESFSVTWKLVEESTILHRSFVNETVEEVYNIHLKSGGQVMAFEIISVEELVAHTTPNAIECATFFATWQALGNEQADLTLKRNGSKWEVLYPLSPHTPPR